MNASTKTFALEPIEKASIDELRTLQLQRMKWSLAHAYAHSPVYKAKFDAAGVHPDDLRQLSDLAKFPFTTKHDLRDNYPFGMFAVPRDQIVRIHASSGTTGKPTVVGYTRKDIDTWADVVARSFRPRARALATCCTRAMATACSRAAWGRTTGPSGWAWRWCPLGVARPKSRSS